MSLAAVAMLSLTACSGDDSESTNNNNNNNNPSFESDLYLDGQLFVPSDNIASVMTTFQEAIDNGVHDVRTFHLMKTGTDIQNTTTVMVAVTYPTGESIDGTYDFIGDGWEIDEPYAQVQVMMGMALYSTMEGAVTVTDLGNNEYKLELGNNIELTSQMNPGEVITLSGSFEGEFTDEGEFE